MEGVAVLEGFGQKSGGEVLVADGTEEAVDGHGADGGGAAVGGGGEGAAVDHGVADFDSCGKAVDEEAAGFAFEDGEEEAGGGGVGVVHLEGSGELAVEVVGGGEELGLVGTLDEEGGGAEDFFEEMGGGEEVGGGGGEEGGLSGAGAGLG